MQTCHDWLAYIESIHHVTIDLGLDRIAEVAQSLNLIQFDCPVILVGGTNGKGSCCRILESILTHQGYRVGCYTSPHLLFFQERIRINEEMISETDLCQAFQMIEEARGGLSLTFFEFTTLAALWLYKRANLDLIILEVGLGGRLDATNIVQADISIITSIDLDHTDLLGSSRESIATEKAGIFKPNAIAICGDPNPPATVSDTAGRVGCTLWQVGKDFDFKGGHTSWTWQSEQMTFEDLPLANLSLMNAATALMAITLLSETHLIDLTAIQKGVQATLAGRYQHISDPPCILDVAHNPAAARLLAKKLERDSIDFSIKSVVGMLKDKDIKNTIQCLVPYIDEWHLGSLKGDRGASAQELGESLLSSDVDYNTYDSVSAAFHGALNNLKPREKILIFGSFYTVAEILDLLQNGAYRTREKCK